MVALSLFGTKPKPSPNEKYAQLTPSPECSATMSLKYNGPKHAPSQDNLCQWATWVFQEKDPEKILGQYFRYHAQLLGKKNIPDLALYHATSPYPGIVRVSITPHLLPGLKVEASNVTKTNIQVQSLGVRPGWIVLFINKGASSRNAYYIFGEGGKNRNVQEQLDLAVKSKEPCDITFFSDAAFWERVMQWMHANQNPMEFALPMVFPTPAVVDKSPKSPRRGSKRRRDSMQGLDEDYVVDYSTLKPPMTDDPKKVLEWFETNFMNSSKYMRSSSQFVKIQFYVSIPHGLKLKGREVMKISDQAFLRGVDSGWLIISIWAKGKMILSPTCKVHDVEEQLNSAMMARLPYTIGFFKSLALWHRIDAAIRFVKEFQNEQERRELLKDVSCATLCVQWPVGNSSSDGLIEALADFRLCEGIADLVKCHGVRKKDVVLNKTSTKTYCTIRVCSDASALAVQEKLNDAKKQGSLASLIRESGVQPLKVEGIQTAINWPLRRLQKVINSEHSYLLSLEQLQELEDLVSDIRDGYLYAWRLTESSEREIAKALEEVESKSLFRKQNEIELMPNSVGKAQALKMHWVTQDAETLPELIADAEEAQMLLKMKFCPKHPWGEMKMNGLESFSFSDCRRTWMSSVDDLAAKGSHFDPAIKPPERVLEKAQSQQTALHEEPPIKEILDVSRLGIVFNSIRLLLHSYRKILKNLDVVWVDNKFRNPLCLGYRDINIGIRQQVRVKDRVVQHVSEVQLMHRPLYEMRNSDGKRHDEAIRSLLAKFGVQKQDESAVHKTILRELDVTDGKAAQEEERNADKLMMFIAEQLADESAELVAAVDDAAKVANDLKDKRFADQAEELAALRAEEEAAIRPEEERRRLAAVKQEEERLAAIKAEEERRRQEEENRRREEERRAAERHKQRVAEERSKPKSIGVYDPCPCGSGKKYKKCHGVTPLTESISMSRHFVGK